MLTAQDIIRLSYTPDLTEGGIAQALRMLPQLYSRANSSMYSRLRRAVAGTAVEIAFRRYLSQQNVDFEVSSAAPFSEPEHYHVSIANQRVHVKSYFISFRDQIRQIQNDPAVLLNAPALVPSDDHAAEGHSERDIYLFAFVTGLTAVSQDDLTKAIRAGQPHYLAFILEEAWRQPHAWGPLGPLSLKSEAEQQVMLDVIGLDSARNHFTQTINLPPGIKTALDDSFYSLSTLRAHHLPKARIGIRSEKLSQTKVIHPLEWSNLWIYGINVYLAGFMRWAEFQQKSRPVYPGSTVFQYKQTHEKNLAVPLTALHPLSGMA